MRRHVVAWIFWDEVPCCCLNILGWGAVLLLEHFGMRCRVVAWTFWDEVPCCCLNILGWGAMLLLERLPTIRSTIFPSSPSFKQSHNDPSELQELLTQLQNIISKKVWNLSNIAARITYLSSFLFLGICMSLIYELGVTAEVWVMSEVVHKVVWYLEWLENCIWLQNFRLCLRWHCMRIAYNEKEP